MKYLLLAVCLLTVSCSTSPLEEELNVWHDVTPDTEAVLSGVYFIDSRQGWVVGDSHCRSNDPCEGTRAAVFSTRDGGITWERTLVETGIHLMGVHFFDRKRGVAASFNVFQSDDAGSTWSEVVKLRGPIIRDMEFPIPALGWAAGNRSDIGAVVLRSEDQGRSWQEVGGSERSDELGGGYYTSISSPSQSTVYVAGRTVMGHPLLVRTQDGGTTWEDVAQPTDPDVVGRLYYAVDFVNESWGWIAGEYRTIFRTTDGGATWERQDAGEGADAIIDIHALDQQHAVAVTSEGAILVTRDGGVRWEEQLDASSGLPLGRAFYTESGTVYVVGNRRVLRARLHE